MTRRAPQEPTRDFKPSHRLRDDAALYAASLGCSGCPDFKTCGGLHTDVGVFDCNDFCSCEDRAACDSVCRLATAFSELIAVGGDEKELLSTESGLTTIEKLKGFDSSNWKTLKSWVDFLEGQGVFYSSPLDLDMEMLVAFPDAYKATISKGGGPSLTPDEAVAVVLGKDGKGIADYKAPEFAGYKDHMPAYRYHFLTRSKPATHIEALTHLDDKAIKKGMSEVYRRLIKHIDENLNRN